MNNGVSVFFRDIRSNIPKLLYLEILMSRKTEVRRQEVVGSGTFNIKNKFELKIDRTPISYLLTSEYVFILAPYF